MEIGTESFQGTGRFRLERCLGRGANGVVYAAKDLKAATHVALKLLTNVHGGSLYRFKQEFRSLADLRHPNLVHLFELLSEREHWFFTMEMIEGENFRDYVCRRTILDPPGTSADSTECSDSDTHSIISQRPLHPGYDEHRLRASLRQLAEGIQAVHDGGKLHRDLKPSNVLVTASLCSTSAWWRNSTGMGSYRAWTSLARRYTCLRSRALVCLWAPRATGTRWA
jgi:serine/threonine protein kinase